MNKQEYLSAIRVRIPKMPTEDMERFIAYYSEMIDDRMEDGMTEEEAVATMDTPDEAVDQILEDTPLSKIVKQKIRPTHRLRAWEIDTCHFMVTGIKHTQWHAIRQLDTFRSLHCQLFRFKNPAFAILTSIIFFHMSSLR